MYEELRLAIDELRNDKAGWVTRRDAAEVLGKVARQALAALDAHRADPDRDVRKAVERALEMVSAPPPSEMVDRTYSLEELARGCEKQDERTVSPHDEGFAVVVRLAEERTQTVYIMPHRRRRRHQPRAYVFLLRRCRPRGHGMGHAQQQQVGTLRFRGPARGRRGSDCPGEQSRSWEGVSPGRESLGQGDRLLRGLAGKETNRIG